MKILERCLGKHKNTIFCELLIVRRYREFTKEKENIGHNIFKSKVQHLEKKNEAIKDYFIGYYRYSPKYNIYRGNGTTVLLEIFFSASIESAGRKSDIQ